jgi:hypothetical protein
LTAGSPDRPVAYDGLHGLSWISQSELGWLIEHLPRDGLFVEVGTASGVTAALIAKARPRLRILCVDSFPDHDAPGLADGEPCRIDHWRRNRRPNMHLFVGTLADLRTFGMDWYPTAILIDGDHSEHAVQDDLKNALGMLVIPPGTLFIHDYDEPLLPGVRAATDRFLRDRPHWAVVDSHATTVLLRGEP